MKKLLVLLIMATLSLCSTIYAVEKWDTEDTVTETQAEIYMHAINQPTTARGYCASWVNNVFNHMLEERISGNACNLYYNYCHSNDIEELDVGMIVAVPCSSSGTVAGYIYGHCGIYVGNGYIMHSIGYIETILLEDWCKTFCQYCDPGWGYPTELVEIIEQELMDKAEEVVED